MTQIAVTIEMSTFLSALEACAIWLMQAKGLDFGQNHAYFLTECLPHLTMCASIGEPWKDSIPCHVAKHI